MDGVRPAPDYRPLLVSSGNRRRLDYDEKDVLPVDLGNSPNKIDESHFRHQHRRNASLKSDSESIRSKKAGSIITLSTIASRLSIPDPWEHKYEQFDPDETRGPGTQRHFRRGPQRWRVFFHGLWQLSITSALCLALFGLCYAEAARPILSANDLEVYNVFNIGLALLIGMSLSSAFKGFAQSIRWQLLSTRYLSLETFDRVMQCESLIATTQLLWTGRVKGRWRPSRIQYYCAVSLVLNLGLQVVVASLGMFLTLQISDDYMTMGIPGDLMIIDWSSIQISSDDSRYSSMVLSWFIPFEATEADVAHLLGVQGWGLLEEGFDVNNITYPYSIFGEDGSSQQWGFVQDGGTRAPLTYTNLTVVSDRSIGCLATCQKYSVSQRSNGTLTFQNNSTGREETIPWSVDSDGSVLTWATWPEKADFGPRSMRVMVLQQNGEQGQIFDCNNTVSHMDTPEYPGYTPSLEECDLPDAQAQIFAGALGDFRADVSTGDTKMYFQCGTGACPSGINMTSGIPFDLGGVSDIDYKPEDIAEMIQLFSLSSLLVFDSFGPRKAVHGFPPSQAQRLAVNWPWTTAVLGGIPLLELLILCVIAYTSSSAVIKDTSYLAAAHLLKPVVERLGHHGNILSGKDIAHRLGNQPVVYGVRYKDARSSDHPVYHVDVIAASEAVESDVDSVWRPGMDMPKGWYD